MEKMDRILKSIGDIIRRVLGSALELVESKAPKAVKVTQAFKEGLEQYGGDIEALLDLTKTEKDNEVFDFIRDELPKLAKEIAFVDGLVDADVSDQEALKIYATYILSKRKEGRAKEFIFLSAKVLGAILGKQMPIDILVMVTQKFYRLLFKK